MKFKKIISLKKEKIITFSIISLVYIAFRTELIMVSKCEVFLQCIDKPKHYVLNIFPRNICGQICANSNELFLGYAQIIITHFLIPLAILYLAIGLFFELKKINK